MNDNIEALITLLQAELHRLAALDRKHVTAAVVHQMRSLRRAIDALEAPPTS